MTSGGLSSGCRQNLPVGLLEKGKCSVSLTEIFIKILAIWNQCGGPTILSQRCLFCHWHLYHLKPHCGEYLYINLHSMVWIISRRHPQLGFIELKASLKGHLRPLIHKLEKARPEVVGSPGEETQAGRWNAQGWRTETACRKERVRHGGYSVGASHLSQQLRSWDSGHCQVAGLVFSKDATSQAWCTFLLAPVGPLGEAQPSPRGRNGQQFLHGPELAWDFQLVGLFLFSPTVKKNAKCSWLGVSASFSFPCLEGKRRQPPCWGPARCQAAPSIRAFCHVPISGARGLCGIAKEAPFRARWLIPPEDQKVRP